MRSFAALTVRGQDRRLRKLAQCALAAYGLRDAQLRLLSRGHNTMFRVEDAGGRRYVLRMQRSGWGTPESVRSEMMWLSALHRDMPRIAPVPMNTVEGDLLTVAAVDGVPEPRICALFGWIDGRFLDAGLTPAHLERVGAFMAQLQLHGSRLAPPNGFVRGRLYSLTGAANRDSRSGGALAREDAHDHDDEAAAVRLVGQVCSPQDAARVEALLDRIHATQREVGYDPDVYGLIHADLHQRNYLFRNGAVAAIDFDDCGYGHYLYDMAVTLSEVQQRTNTAALRAAFLTGYRSVWSLSAEHEGYLDTFIALRELQNLIWRIESRDEPAFRDVWEPIVQKMLRNVRAFVEG